MCPIRIAWMGDGKVRAAKLRQRCALQGLVLSVCTLALGSSARAQAPVSQPAQASAEPACTSGCTIELDSGEQYEMEGGEVVAIEDGSIFVDAVPAQQ